MPLTEILAVSGVRAIVRMCVKVIVGGCSVEVSHLVSNPDCYKVHSSFSVLCGACHDYKLQLQVSEAVCQCIHRPNMCVQKDSIIHSKSLK